MSLQEKLEAVLSESSATFGVVVKHLETQEEAQINSNDYFQMASTFKVPILATLFRDVSEGRLSLEQRIRLTEDDLVPGSGVLQEFLPGAEVAVKDLAMLMIIVSDNLGTDKVLELVGTERVEAFMKELGLAHISIRNSCWELLSIGGGLGGEKKGLEGFHKLKQKFQTSGIDADSVIFQPIPENNVATPADMGKLLELIATGQLVSQEACDSILDIMKRQQLRNRIPYLLPDKTIIACKSGTIGSVVNDVGIVYLPEGKGAFTIAAFSHGNHSTKEGERMIARLTLTAYEHFAHSEE
ncbi:serine hydrolase [Brevibacillus choshinensis]|uniref:Serine hydrolase n=1 Tax=Brevibacillus choshinensis TaxID=54911 RepID=A0ABR5N0A6_BRECH|nr:serine hydrolase [Brevibacillus choshinensis]KQL43920.1 serine hydrolase [Brevibacillus choshinensis]